MNAETRKMGREWVVCETFAAFKIFVRWALTSHTTLSQPYSMESQNVSLTNFNQETEKFQKQFLLVE